MRAATVSGSPTAMGFSYYAQTNPREDFAETWDYFLRYREWLGRVAFTGAALVFTVYG